MEQTIIMEFLLVCFVLFHFNFLMKAFGIPKDITHVHSHKKILHIISGVHRPALKPKVGPGILGKDSSYLRHFQIYLSELHMHSFGSP